MSKLLKKYFEEFSNNDRMGHAFLICNATYASIKDELDDILSSHFFNGKSIHDVYNDLIVISPSNSKILKEDIITLQSELMTKSSLNENRVYIIDGADKMNDYASNSLLKFLEEPEDNIYAFLICENINRVLPTIRSRCNRIILEDTSMFDLSSFDSETVKTAIDFIKLVEEKKLSASPYISSLFDKKVDKDLIVNIISIIKYFYYSIINNILVKSDIPFVDYSDVINIVISNNDIFKLTNKLISINKLENMLEYNVNMNLFVDKLVYELGCDSND